MKRRLVYSHLFSATIFLCFAINTYAQQKSEPLLIVIPAAASARIKFGSEKLIEALNKAGYKIKLQQKDEVPVNSKFIAIGELNNALTKEATNIFKLDLNKHATKESFQIATANKSIFIAGADASGSLYGCLELASQIKTTGKLPENISVTDQPEMVLRGACIGLQKSTYLPGRNVYEYPYTPETFPWFYDKKLWIQCLDSLVENRMNSLYLWNGHPFASLVRLKEYPYAVEVDDATFKKNEEIYKFLTTEADKRGIWVIQMFYNIIVSKPFAEKHGIKTQDRERPIIPSIADYTRKSIAAFVQKYPNVGLMVCLGEAMEGVGNDDVEWFTKTIIPGVKDGLKALGKRDEPPIVLRAHDTDAPTVMKAALPLYKNLYTEAKFNGEALTTPEPRGKWADLHQTLSRIGTIHIENVHILANLEPFRYGSADFIQKSVKGMLKIMEGKGLHLYPQASYWDWPYTADSVKGKRLLQIERDWIWYKAWSRYAWKSNRNRNDEIDYWSSLFAAKYGCSKEAGKNILEAYEQSGEIAPKILRRFGITDGNRQTMTLGMLMTQLINPFRFGLFTLMYESESPVGEMLTEYAEKDWKGQNHIGETPPQVINEITAHGKKAVDAIKKAASSITKNKKEFERLKNDMYCYQALANHYAEKAEAALYVLRYKYSENIRDLEKAWPYLKKSVASYKQLSDLTNGTYLYANSMQTQQRKIPIRGVEGTFKKWSEVLIPFEQELAHFERKIDSLKNNTSAKAKQTIILKSAEVNVTNKVNGFYVVDSVAKLFADTALYIMFYANELKGLQGIPFSFKQQLKEGSTISFQNTKPVKVLVGFFKSKDSSFLKAPELETNASANDYGQAETKIANALVIKGMPPVNIHSYSFKPGSNTLKLARGAALILGFVDNDQEIPMYDAGLTETGVKKEIDWLFE